MSRPTLAERLQRLNREYARRKRSKKAAEEFHRNAVEVMRRLLRRENAQARRGEQ